MKVSKPDNLEWNNSLILVLSILEVFGDCESFFESSSPYILVLCETDLEESLDLTF